MNDFSDKSKYLLLSLLAVFCNISANAVSAYPELIDFRQPDGKIVKVRMLGDEYVKFAETEDGYTLIYGDEGALVYADLDNNNELVPSGFRATNINDRPQDVCLFLTQKSRKLSYSISQIERFKESMTSIRRSPKDRTSRMPVTGQKKFLTILVEFSDVKFKNTKDEFYNLLNEEGYSADGAFGSVRDFYLENSFGQLDINTDVAGIYTLPNSRDYYGKNTPMSDYNAREMAIEAIGMADLDVNLSDYDNDKDGIIDGVHIIYAGCGEEAGGGANCIWAHSSSVNYTGDGVSTYRYSCSPEIRGASPYGGITRIGVICHELGHVLGCKDYYDTNYGTDGQYPGCGEWDLMASGSWNNDGAIPAHFNPFVKIYDYQWGVACNGNVPGEFTLGSHSPDGFVRIDTKTDGEFFLLEYRSQKGFDSAIPGHGLMIYRSSGNMDRMSFNTLNAKHRQQFYIVSASSPLELPNEDPKSYGSVDASATFSDFSNHMAFTDVTVPSMKSWDGVETDCPVTEITENMIDDNVHFFISGGPFGGAYNFRVYDTDTDHISLKWEKHHSEEVLLAFNDTNSFGHPESPGFDIGEEIPGGGKVIYWGTDSLFSHTGLQENQSLYYALFTRMDNGGWTPARIAKGKTETGIIRQFPFEEDFASRSLGRYWRNECIYSDSEWAVDFLLESSDSQLIFNTKSGIPRQKSRIIIPTIDFTGKKCAILSLDVRNWIQAIEVAYRTSSDDDWHLLQTIDSDFRNTVITEDEKSMFLNCEKTINIPLHNLNSTYQISVTADYKSRVNSHSPLEMATIDNISISADYKAFVSTGSHPFISGNYCLVSVEAVDGLENVIEKGVAWSYDGTEWHYTEAGDDNIARITGLNKESEFYYKGYAKTVSGMVFSQISSAITTTVSLSGLGSIDNPYILGSDADWNELRATVKSGLECDGIYFALDSDISLERPDMINGIFNGILDGRGHTITVPEDTQFEALFLRIGENGCVKNLKFKANTLYSIDKKPVGASICVYNYGYIIACDINIDKYLSGQWSANLAGVCRNNYGIIVNTHVDACFEYLFDDPTAAIWSADFAGVCLFNSGLLSCCTYRGEMSAHSESYLAGIAVQNTSTNKSGKDVAGIISGCVNYGTLKVRPFYDKSNGIHIGGIVCSNDGNISESVNAGDIIADISGVGSNNYIGGLVAFCSRGEISDCMVSGQMSISGDAEVKSGELVGYFYMTQMKNCIACLSGNIGTTESIGNVIGQLSIGYIDNCWTTDNDCYPIDGVLAVTSMENTVDALNAGRETTPWLLLGDTLRLSVMHGSPLITPNHIVDFSESYMHTEAAVFLSDSRSTGYEWRKKGSSSWNHVECELLDNIIDVEITGLEPASRYEMRYFAVDNKDVVWYSDPVSFATLFTSSGTISDPVIIHDYDELWTLNELIAHGENFAGQVIRLGADIDLGSGNDPFWFPMQSRLYQGSLYHFAGEFDGCGKTIRNMRIDSDRNYVGFFGHTSNGGVHDLNIIDADITSRIIGSNSSVAGDVGGIAGFSSGSSESVCKIERCGFSGNISGGFFTGGIAGICQTDAIIDCFAVGNITGKSFTAGIVASGNAINSYFSGSISGYGNISAISCRYGNINDNCYYNANGVNNLRGGTYISMEEMKTDRFMNMLSSNWDRSDLVNDGFPVPYSLANSRVTTNAARLNSNADIQLYGLYIQGADRNYQSRGFQWYSKSGETPIVNEMTSTSSDMSFSQLIPNTLVSNEGINFRAVAFENNDSIYGEWKSFLPDISLPKPLLYKFTWLDDGSLTLSYSITNDDNLEITNAALFYGIADTDADNYAYKLLDIDASDVELYDLDKDCSYSAYIKVETNDGYVSESPLYEFSFFKTESATMIDTEEIVDIYTLDGIPSALSTTISEFSKVCMPGIYIVKGKKVCIKK